MNHSRIDRQTDRQTDCSMRNHSAIYTGTENAGVTGDKSEGYNKTILELDNAVFIYS